MTMPETLLESGFPWRALRDVARREGTVKPPIYAMHRWWARRSPTLFRTILAAAALTSGSQENLEAAAASPSLLAGKRVLDPFMGGGTSLVEAARLGAAVIGFDVEPLAAAITEAELAAFGRDIDWTELELELEVLTHEMQQFYPAPAGWQVLHYFWVGSANCTSCHRRIDLHPTATLAADESRDFRVVVCLYCSALHRISFDRRRVDCSCGGRTIVDARTTSMGVATCPHCGSRQRLIDIASREGQIPYRLFAKELINSHDSNVRRFAAITRTDIAAYSDAVLEASRLRPGAFPDGAIPLGRGDGRPQVFGVTRWRDMFNSRQLLHHARVRRRFANLREPTRRYGRLAFSESLATNCMFCFYSPTYRRIAAAFSIHGYMWVSRPTELNPWLLGSGRGTLQNCVRKIHRGTFL